MDGWLDGTKSTHTITHNNGWMDRWLVGWMDGWLDGTKSTHTITHNNGWMDRWLVGSMVLSLQVMADAKQFHM